MRIVSALLLLLVFSSSCHFMGHRVRGNGHLITQTRNVGSFSGIHDVGGMDVIVNPGTDYTVKVEADENLLPYIITNIDGDALVMKTRDGYNLQSRSGMKIYVTTPDLRDVRISGNGSVISGAKLTGHERLNIHVSGNGDVKLNIDAPAVATQTTGNGNIMLTGNTRDFTTEINGNGEVKCFNLLSENTNVKISGNGSAEVFASKQLDVHISGSGDVAYKGTPSINQHIAGSGDVRNVP
jgi:hypothetical protein